MRKLIESLSNLPMSSYNQSKRSKASRVASKSVFVFSTVCVFAYVSTPAQKLTHGQIWKQRSGEILVQGERKEKKKTSEEKGR